MKAFHPAFGIVAIGVFLSAPASSQEAPAKPTFDADGTVNVPAIELPPSDFLSPEARAQQALHRDVIDKFLPSLIRWT